jgi:hypothetical protein
MTLDRRAAMAALVKDRDDDLLVVPGLGSTIEPIGTCHGLNSSHSPRMVMKVTIGRRQLRISDSMLTQLPTPLDCISSAARWPPSQAPAASATPSSSVVSDTSRMPASARQRAISRAWPASGT